MHWKLQIQVFKQKDAFKGWNLIVLEGAMSALTLDAHFSLNTHWYFNIILADSDYMLKLNLNEGLD